MEPHTVCVVSVYYSDRHAFHYHTPALRFRGERYRLIPRICVAELLVVPFSMPICIPDFQFQPECPVFMQCGHRTGACRTIHIKAHIRLIYRHGLVCIAIFIICAGHADRTPFKCCPASGASRPICRTLVDIRIIEQVQAVCRFPCLQLDSVEPHRPRGILEIQIYAYLIDSRWEIRCQRQPHPVVGCPRQAIIHPFLAHVGVPVKPRDVHRCTAVFQNGHHVFRFHVCRQRHRPISRQTNPLCVKAAVRCTGKRYFQ